MTALVVILFISDVLGMIWCLALRARIERLETIDFVRNVQASIDRVLIAPPDPREIAVRPIQRDPLGHRPPFTPNTVADGIPTKDAPR